MPRASIPCAQECTQYLVWDAQEEEDVEDEVMSELFAVEDRDEGRRGRSSGKDRGHEKARKAKNAKKSKKRKSSSTSRSVSDASSGSSEE